MVMLDRWVVGGEWWVGRQRGWQGGVGWRLFPALRELRPCIFIAQFFDSAKDFGHGLGIRQ